MATKTDQSLVTTNLLINGSPVKKGFDIVGVSVRKAVNRIASASVELIDGSAAKENFPLSDSDTFIPGNDIEIQVAFGLNQHSIFKGSIVSQGIKIRKKQGSLLVLNCKDKALDMTLERKNRVFTDKSDSDMLKQIIGSYGLTSKIKSSSYSYSQMLQYYATDWDFLISRAEVNGLLVINSDNEISIEKPRTSNSDSLSLSYGKDIFEFDSSLSSDSQFTKVKAQAWSYKEQKIQQIEVSDVEVAKEGNLSGSKIAINSAAYDLQTTAPLAEEELQAWAGGKLIKSRLSKIRGRIKTYGKKEYAPNKIVELKGLGNRFNGSGYISEVEHSIEHGNWWTYLELGLSPEWFSNEFSITAAEASGLLPGIQGLQNGIVKQITEDPLEETRILVEIPITKGSEEAASIWARWAQPYASADAGQFFMPEIEDEVVLGFLNSDPRFPVILGSLYSSKHAPPLSPDKKNSIKAIVSKSLLKIEFNDEEKVLHLKTPENNQLSLDDKNKKITLTDAHGNQILMDENGISLQSSKDIALSAKGKVNIQGKEGLTLSTDAQASISAESNLSVSGLEVSLSAETSFSASGDAETSISSSGELSLEGSLIMIN